jgi:hypothetical protein
MTGLSDKDKQALATLYEYPEFKALVKWNELKRTQIGSQIIGVTMGQPGSSERVAMLQGQAEAHRFMLLEIKKIHKDNTKEP